MDETTGTEGENQEVEFTPVEQEALDAGWVPKEQFKGDEHKWVDAGEFLRRGELFKKIEDQSKELKDVRKALADLSKLNEEIRKTEYDRALTTLRNQRKLAMAEGDVDAVDLIEEKMDAIKEEKRNLEDNPPVKLPQEPAQGEQHPEFRDWLSRNSWYSTNEGMKAYADAVGMRLRASGMAPGEVLKKVAEAVREEFPKRFTNENRSKPGAVESGNTRGKSSSSGITLTDDERRIMNRFIRQGVLTEAQYIESLKKVRG